MTILVTGATGHLGGLVIDALLARGAEPGDIIAVGRNTERLSGLAGRGLGTAVVDYTDPATVAAAVAGADTVLLISGNEIGQRLAQHRNVIEAAARAGVTRFAYTSAPFATTSTLLLAPEHKATEEAIAEAGLPAVILRNNWYNENAVPDYERATASGVLLTSAGDGRIAYAARADYAEAAAAVLLAAEPPAAVLELAGDRALLPEDVAESFAAVSGRPVEVRHVTGDEHRAALLAAGVPEAAVGFAVALDANVADGTLGYTDGTLSRLLGRPTTPLADTLREAR
ncbi:NAD(P)H-binding protein [Propionicicella superfundia]|uniref:NAD(P)H-binding protein n=1 Tax=Propionicicella superfundia TaxID=348582 RepID=UPI0003FAF2A9|nr:NAD(P)H-binding protein [Propionicicella superfundia]